MFDQFEASNFNCGEVLDVGDDAEIIQTDGGNDDSIVEREALANGVVTKVLSGICCFCFFMFSVFFNSIDFFGLFILYLNEYLYVFFVIYVTYRKVIQVGTCNLNWNILKIFQLLSC